MIQLWFSPLAPPICLLVGAISVKLAGRASKLSLGVSLLTLGLLLSRVVFGLPISFSTEPILFSDWGMGNVLSIGVDELSFAFLLMPILLLIALFWAQRTADAPLQLALSAAAAIVFVAANGLSAGYALFLFDIIGVYYWLNRRQPHLATGRLLLAVLTSGCLVLIGLGWQPIWANAGLALALWLRICLIPFSETAVLSDGEVQADQTMFWIALSTVVGVFVAARFLTVPLPELVLILTLGVLLLNAWLAWLDNSTPPQRKLLRLISLQPGLALLMTPLTAEVAVSLGLGYSLSLGVLWLTPQLGRPNLAERHWSWQYSAAFLATLTLIGFPFTFGWLTFDWLYVTLLARELVVVTATVLLAQGIALSVLIRYWAWLLSGQSEWEAELDLRATLILAVPFLAPWLGGLTLGIITGLSFEANWWETSGDLYIWGILVVTWLLAVSFGTNRRRILTGLGLEPEGVDGVLELHWLWSGLYTGVDLIGRAILRFRSVLEGAHYLGWAFLVALAGILVVILN